MRLLVLEDRFANHQENPCLLLLQLNLLGIGRHNLPPPPKNLLANRWDLHKSERFTKGALFFSDVFAENGRMMNKGNC